MNQHRVFHATSARPVHVGSHSNWLREIGEPEGEIEQRITILEKGSATRFRLAVSPSLLRGAKLILPCAHTRHASELTTFEKTTQLLNIAPEAVVIAHYNFPIRGDGGGEDAIHSAGSERKRALTKHMHLRLERAKYMRLVQVIGRGDDNGIELIRIEKLIDVGENVGNSKALSECTGLWTIVIADGNKTRAANL